MQRQVIADRSDGKWPHRVVRGIVQDDYGPARQAGEIGYVSRQKFIAIRIEGQYLRWRNAIGIAVVAIADAAGVWRCGGRR